MTNVVSLFDALPERVIDRRIDALYRKFAHRQFSTAEGAQATGMEHHEFWKEFFYHEREDDRFRVCSTTNGFYLVKVDPARAALPHWRQRYLPVMRKHLGGDTFSIQRLAIVLHIPYASATYLAGQFVSAGLLISCDEKFRLPPRRKVIMNVTRPKVRWGGLVYQGY